MVTFLLKSAISATALFGASLILRIAMRRMSAARVHLLLTLFTVAVLAVPVLTAIVPPLRIPGLTGSVSGVNILTPEPAQADVVPPVLPDSHAVEWKAWIAPAFAAAWLIGVLVFLSPLGAGLIRLRYRTRCARRLMGAEWEALITAACQRLGVTRAVRVLLSDVEEVPMTWGVFHPSILLPPSAEQWPADQTQVVLEHELAHVKRLDFVTQLCALLARALHWYNPLAWVTAQSLRDSAERACDDQILNAGTRPSQYAAALVDLCGAFWHKTAPRLAAVAMAQSNLIEQRVRRVLETNCDRRRAGRWTFAVMLAGVCFFSAAVGLLNPIVRAADAKSPVVMKIPAAQSSANASTAPGKEVIRGGVRYYFVDTVPGGIPVKIPIEGADFITNTNTAIYDGRSIVRDHKASKKGRQELEDYVKAQNDEVQKEVEELSKRKEEFDAVKSSLSTEEAVRQEAEIAALHQEYLADLQKRQQDVDAREQAVMKGISEEIKQAAASVAAQKGFKYIQSSFNWHPEKVAGTDITAQVRAKLGDKLETGQGKKSN